MLWETASGTGRHIKRNSFSLLFCNRVATHKIFFRKRLLNCDENQIRLINQGLPPENHQAQWGPQKVPPLSFGAKREHLLLASWWYGCCFVLRAEDLSETLGLAMGSRWWHLCLDCDSVNFDKVT